MRDVNRPIRNMVNTVDRIRRGQLDSRVEGFMLGELDMLKNGINSMANVAGAYHEEMNTISTRRRPICVRRWSRWKFRTLSWIWRKSAPGSGAY